jgi:hypothetical protein
VVVGVYREESIVRMGRNSRKLPGQPCSIKMDTASSFSLNRARKWILKDVPSVSVIRSLYLGKVFVCASDLGLECP